MIVRFALLSSLDWWGNRTVVDLVVGEALGLVVALESVLGLVHESRHCDLGCLEVWVLGLC
jgi:hypothetical protein